jgi:eukaryotic-like serine/threonine-protein kinase
MRDSCPICQQPLADDVPSCPHCGAPLGDTGGDAAAKTQVLSHPPETREYLLGVGSKAVFGTVPALIGRYRVLKEIGQGGGGRVYQARDDELDRPVAIKVPLPDRLLTEADAERLLREARAAARLKHPGIVTVYDFGRLPNRGVYIVMEYVAGPTLAQLFAASRLDSDRAAWLVHEVAVAIDYAHHEGLIHRDLKPSNVLIGPSGHPQVADFGLAITEQASHLVHGEVSGTPGYMAPEQVRGEAHRIDRRTDIWALGVVLYEALSGRMPFPGPREQQFESILNRDPKPPRQLDDAIPRELERICLKCLAKRMTERYATAADLAEDLRAWLLEAEGDIGPVSTDTDGKADGAPASVIAQDTHHGPRVVPRGLRAYDSRDADFFLRLLPGPRDRRGLPDSVRFWKARIEEFDPEKTFPVGLIYGPSGCGKSSLVKAGLLPRLAASVVSVYLEATPGGTEERLLTALRRKWPALPDGLALGQLLALIRTGEGPPADQKVLVVIDQFEQWLHANSDAPDPELARALRHCDGKRLQCLLMVRDDFWMAISRFMRDLEIPLREGENSAAVDLFSVRHARKVLFEFGRSLGCLPAELDQLTPPQEDFLDRSAAELARDGKVSPVRLNVFTEMVKARTWEPETLKRLGGFQGIGVTFLEDTFSSAAAPLSHRRHERAARSVLTALLPDRGTDIKGVTRSRRELLAASGYTREADFDDLLHVLDTELRLVTPADPEGVKADEGAPGYQLTHDYLVPSLREWLTRKQRESWRGRAALALEERTVEWSRARDARFLPSLAEYAAIRLAVPRERRKPEQQALVRAATRFHAVRWGGVLAAALAIGVVVRLYVGSVRETNREQRAATLVEALLRAHPDGVPYVVENLRSVRDVAVPLLRQRLADPDLDERKGMHAAMALVELGEPDDDFLLKRIATAPDDELHVLAMALERVGDSAREHLVQRFHAAQDVRDATQEVRDARRTARARLAATLLHLDSPDTVARLAVPRDGDPSDSTKFISSFRAWRADAGKVAKLLGSADSADLRAMLCLALAEIPRDEILSDHQPALQAALLDLYQNDADRCVHSAAGLVLRRWGGPEYALPAVQGPSGASPPWFVNGQGMTMLYIPAGSYTMGEMGIGERKRNEARPHPVQLTRSFYMCDRETWRDLFERYRDDPDCPADLKPKGAGPAADVSPSGNHPVQMVSWGDAVRFCNWLSWKEGRTACYGHFRIIGDARVPERKETVAIEHWDCDFNANGYRLPTEAEWEYACRAGTATSYSFGDDDEELRHYAEFDKSQAAPVAMKLPNPWGLFDMHGNVREWCWDFWQDSYPAAWLYLLPPYAIYLHGWEFPKDNYPLGLAIDPTGPDVPSAVHLQRGGSWYDLGRACRSAERITNPFPPFVDRISGIRVVCTAPPPAAPDKTPVPDKTPTASEKP